MKKNEAIQLNNPSEYEYGLLSSLGNPKKKWNHIYKTEKLGSSPDSILGMVETKSFVKFLRKVSDNILEVECQYGIGYIHKKSLQEEVSFLSKKK